MMAFRKLCVISLLNVESLRIPLSLPACRNVKRWVAPTLRELKKRKDKMGPQPPTHRSTFLEWNYNAELFAFGKRLNESFQSGLLQKALTHRSYIVQEESRQRELGFEDPKLSLEDNTLLSKEGEELMSHYVKQYLRFSLPLLPEDGICGVHDWLMSNEVLAKVSSGIGTKDLILSSDFPVQEETLATTFKAVVGALLQSSGLQQAQVFVRDFVITQIAGRDIVDIWDINEPMSVLTDILAREGKDVPEPRLINETAKNTILATYQVGIYSDKQHIATGSGESIEIATRMAAADALRRLFKIPENMRPVKFNQFVPASDRKNVPLHAWSSKGAVHSQ